MIFITILLPLVFSVQSSAIPTSLHQDIVLKKYFEPNEIAELDSIRVYFNEQILYHCQDSKGLASCYRQFFELLRHQRSLDTLLSYEKQWKFYPKIDRQVFNSIWSYAVHRANETSSRKYYNSIDYAPEGRYRKFLKEVSEDEPYFKQYVEPITSSGTLPPNLLVGFARDSSGLNFDNLRHQLILAVHFMTFLDQIATSPY